VQLRAAGAVDTAAGTLYDLAFAHARLDETEEAILNALECERALKAGELTDRTVELELRSMLASLYLRRGDFAAGDLQIERALQLAEDVSSRKARAALYASWAKAEQERGDPARATGFWERSLRELQGLPYRASAVIAARRLTPDPCFADPSFPAQIHRSVSRKPNTEASAGNRTRDEGFCVWLLTAITPAARR
jgi:tetratricopeptide (TPR) repeat protein